jgi:hypothetical protein
MRRADLTRRFRADFEANLKALRVGEVEFNDLLDCEVSEYIKWVNTTDCSYLYDKTTKSLEKHLEEQTACLNRVGSATRLGEIDLACSKHYLPNDWSIYSDVFAMSFAKRFDRQRANSPIAQRVGACAGAQYVTQLNQTGCPPMNLEASTKEALFATDCIDKLRPTLDRQMIAILQDCKAAIRRE